MPRVLLCLGIYAALGASAPAQLPPTPPLKREAIITLPHTSGRIDHLTIDAARERLIVAEFGNGTVDVVDVRTRKVIHRIAGLDEPQGVAYVPLSDLLAVTSGGDGTVKMFAGNDYAPRGSIALGEDSDNVRRGPAAGNIVVGHGSGGLAIIDPANSAKLSDIALPDHPEGFQLSDGRAYVNVPSAHQIDVVDLVSGKLIVAWTPGHLTANFPMALDGEGHVAVVFRGQDRLVLFDAAAGRPTAMIDTCGDADDVFFDDKRKRFMVSCGAGAVEVFAFDGAMLQSRGRVSTAPGARTCLFVPALDRLFVAVPAGRFGSPAAIEIFRPATQLRRPSPAFGPRARDMHD